jgi:hypothetical protein
VLETRRVLVTLKWPDFDSNTPILDAQVRAMRRIFGPDVDVSLTLEQADLALALGSYVGALWPIKVSHAQVPDGPRRMLAVAAILGAGGDLWREVSEWVKRELEPSEDNQATMLSNPKLLEQVWGVIYVQLLPFGLSVPNRPPIPNARNRGPAAVAQKATTRCHRCGQQVPSSHLVRQFMPKGMGNRRRNDWV